MNMSTRLHQVLLIHDCIVICSRVHNIQYCIKHHTETFYMMSEAESDYIISGILNMQQLPLISKI